MKQSIFTLQSNELLAKDVYRMRLQGDCSAITAPGQFVNIAVDGCYLRRPISVCDCENDVLTLIYKVVGKGTKILSQMPVGTKSNILTGLGNGYDLEKSGNEPILVGGGVGVPPLYLLCKKLVAQKKKPKVILGFHCIDDVFYEKEFRALSEDVTVTTVDGSYGQKGFVTDVLKEKDYTFFYTCGPEPMFRAMSKTVKTAGQYSFEERMGCGFGACMGCSCQTLTGNKRICKEGPVMESEEIKWDD